MRGTYCAAGSEAAARASESMCGAFETGRVARRNTTSDFCDDAGNLSAKDLRELSQQTSISLDSSENACHVKRRFPHRRDMRLRRFCAAGDSSDGFDERKELSRVHRFGKVLVGPRSQTRFAVAFHRVRRQRHNWHVDACRFFCLPNGCSGLQTIHLRHLHIHENEVEYAGRNGGDGFAPINDADRRMTAFREESSHELSVHGVVFRQKDA